MLPVYRTLAAVPSQVLTANGQTGTLAEGFGNVDGVRAALLVTAASGTTPTLDVFIEDTPDDTNWLIVAKFAQVTAPGVSVINLLREQGQQVLANFSPLWFNHWRVRWALTGTTPSFTASVLLGYR